MPRAASKTDLVKTAEEQFGKLQGLIDSMPEDERNAAFSFELSPSQKEAHWTRDRNLRDVLIHLYEWHNLLLNWVSSNTSGRRVPFLPEPYSWKTYGGMNAGFWEKHQGTPLDESMNMLKDSHSAVMSLIDGFSDGELFGKENTAWTGTSSLGSYCVSVTASHYDWAMKKLKAHRKSYKGR